MQDILTLSELCLQSLTDFVGELRLDDAAARTVEGIRAYTGAEQVALVQTVGAVPELRLSDAVTDGALDAPTLTAILARAASELGTALEPHAFRADAAEMPAVVEALMAARGVERLLVLPIAVEPGLCFALGVLGGIVDLEADEGWHYVATIARGFACAVRDRRSRQQALPRVA